MTSKIYDHRHLNNNITILSINNNSNRTILEKSRVVATMTLVDQSSITTKSNNDQSTIVD
jgi:hypothetical protein